ncbi:hypothetical protein DU80_09265 [Methanosarcina mazei]|uniref:Uncharacterized protein n=1 Tax=Methanosarcina mazei TaxID=2209 RepID=A0A0F8PZE6_METMZ|nr:hypothetical protein DU31_08275 [Methanosarcina mazei]KKG01150.1 hypothetical protein DU47_08625 [Methanosarcina mazei]KKG04725.1 hypothetical protein DU40_19915 [Methanosarcina mazei]KKG35718.1 hypothetical protein DU30_06105 [Methanosarcina mazei]KKG37418.1 hypothetical protein DU52_07870 [Methanosarcina mazei]
MIRCIRLHFLAEEYTLNIYLFQYTNILTCLKLWKLFTILSLLSCSHVARILRGISRTFRKICPDSALYSFRIFPW